MLASKELIDAVNRQVGNEFGASLQYVSIASYFDGQALTGFQKLEHEFLIHRPSTFGPACVAS